MDTTENNFITLPPERQPWLDWLRVIATLFIIVIHVCARPLNLYEGVSNGQWILALILRNIATVGVPMFFMISGYLYLTRPPMPIKEFLRRRLAIIVIPFLVWSYFWLLYNHQFDLSIALTPSSWIAPIVGKTNYHLWFMYPLIGLYFALPLMVRLYRNLTLNERGYLLAIWLIFNGAMSYLGYLDFFGNGIPAQFITIWVGYFFAGAIVAGIPLQTPQRLWPVCLAILLGMILVSFVVSARLHLTFPGAFEVTTLHLMILSCGLFALAAAYKDYFGSNRLIRFLSPKCYAIYLVHPLFILEAEKNLYADPQQLPVYYIPLMIGITAVGSILVATLNHSLRLQRMLG